MKSTDVRSRLSFRALFHPPPHGRQDCATCFGPKRRCTSATGRVDNGGGSSDSPAMRRPYPAARVKLHTQARTAGRRGKSQPRRRLKRCDDWLGRGLRFLQSRRQGCFRPRRPLSQLLKGGAGNFASASRPVPKVFRARPGRPADQVWGVSVVYSLTIRLLRDAAGRAPLAKFLRILRDTEGLRKPTIPGTASASNRDQEFALP